MAEIAFPTCTVNSFAYRVDDSGRTRYESAYGPQDYVVGPGWSRLAGSIGFTPMSDAEDAALQAFLLDLDGDSDDHVYLPWFRDAGRGGEGVFPPGTTFNVTAAADSGTDETAVQFAASMDKRYTDADVFMHVGAVLTLNDVLVRVRTVNSYGGGDASLVVFPRVPSASPNVVREGRVKARLAASTALLGRTGKVPGRNPILIPWVEVP